MGHETARDGLAAEGDVVSGLGIPGEILSIDRALAIPLQRIVMQRIPATAAPSSSSAFCLVRLIPMTGNSRAVSRGCLVLLAGHRPGES